MSTDNPLMALPNDSKREQFPKTLQGWVDRGNRRLAEMGRAHELEWVASNGRPTLVIRHGN